MLYVCMSNIRLSRYIVMPRIHTEYNWRNRRRLNKRSRNKCLRIRRRIINNNK